MKIYAGTDKTLEKKKRSERIKKSRLHKKIMIDKIRARTPKGPVVVKTLSDKVINTTTV